VTSRCLFVSFFLSGVCSLAGDRGQLDGDLHLVVTRKGKRRDFEDSLPKRVSKTGEVDAVLRKYVGPDSFYVEAIGPEVLATQKCQHLWHPKTHTTADASAESLVSYVFTVHLTVPGTYVFRVTHMFAQYQAILEEEKMGALMTVMNRVIFEREHTLLHPAQSSTSPPDGSKSLESCHEVSGSWRYVEVPSATNIVEATGENRSLLWAAPCLPGCLLEKQAELVNVSFGGHWTRPLTDSKVNPTSSSGAILWSPTTRRDDNTPESQTGQKKEQCGLFEWEEAREGEAAVLEGKCRLQGKSVLFQGDSHLQQVLMSFGHWVLGVPSDVHLISVCKDLMQPGNSTQVPGGTVSVPLSLTCVYRHRAEQEVSLSFALSRYGEPSVLGYSGYDIILVNFGQWPAATKTRHGGHWTLEKYWKRARLLAKSISGSKQRGRVVWMSTPAFPERMTQEVDADGRPPIGVLTDDWRNNVRLELMNELAAREMRKAGIEVLDVFSLTFPLKVSTDNIHYLTLHQHVLLRYLLSLLCSP